MKCCAWRVHRLWWRLGVLVNKGAEGEYIIEAWRLGSDTWALRGRLGVIANIRLDGERRASHSARNGSPVDSQGEGAL